MRAIEVRPSALIIIVLLSVFTMSAAQEIDMRGHKVAEIKLLDPLDETRGWCVDLFAHRTNAIPLGGFQGHNCFLYMGLGPTEDQGFDIEQIKDKGEFYLVFWDVCMTLYEPKSGSFVAAESCSGEKNQQFELRDDGQIVSKQAPELCLTLGALSIPGGGRLAPVGARPPATNEGIPQIRRLTFDACSQEKAILQHWGLRDSYEESERTIPHRFLLSDKNQ